MPLLCQFLALLLRGPDVRNSFRLFSWFPDLITLNWVTYEPPQYVHAFELLHQAPPVGRHQHDFLPDLGLQDAHLTGNLTLPPALPLSTRVVASPGLDPLPDLERRVQDGIPLPDDGLSFLVDLLLVLGLL